MEKTKTMNYQSFTFKPLDGYMQEYFNKTHSNYIYHLSGNNINANLFKIDIANSSVSNGANSALERIGEESPYRYIKIENVPIFNVSSIEIPVGWSEDSGYTTDLRIECVAQPSVIGIEVDDYLSLTYSSNKNLWRVIEAHPDCFEEVYYTKLTLVPTQYTEENINFQVRKRMSYVFESCSVIDKNTNDTLNSILSMLREHYRTFLSEYYAQQGIFIKREVLNSLSSKYFKFKELPDDVLVFNYFFKKYLSTAPITVYVDQKELMNRFLNYTNPDEYILKLKDDEAKFLFKFMTYLDEFKTISSALSNTLLYIKSLKTDMSISEPKRVFEVFSSPYEDIFNMDFYSLVIETAKYIENIGNIVDPDEKNSIKVFNNLKKIIKMISNKSEKDSFLKSLITLMLFKSVPFKNISYGVRDMEYGE